MRWSRSGRVTGAILESKSGRQAVLARVCVDATGDGDVAAQAGAAFELHSMRIGLNAKIGGVDLEAFHGWQEDSPEHARALRSMVQAAGGVPMGAGTTPHEDLGVYWVNVLGLTNRGDDPQAARPGGAFGGELNAVDVEDLTYAEVELRKRFMVGLEYYRKNVPGYGNARLLSFASELGVRDSRRIKGVHHLTRAEMDAGARFADAIGITGPDLCQRQPPAGALSHPGPGDGRWAAGCRALHQRRRRADRPDPRHPALHDDRPGRGHGGGVGRARGGAAAGGGGGEAEGGVGCGGGDSARSE